MKSLNEIQGILLERLPLLKRKYPIESIAMFGSVARGESTSESDIDLLVDFSGPIGFEIVDLVLDLEELLETKVDLVSRKAIKPRMMPFIEKDLVYVAA
jgi:predicted nucleotidyltransferase